MSISSSKRTWRAASRLTRRAARRCSPSAESSSARKSAATRGVFVSSRTYFRISGTRCGRCAALQLSRRPRS